MANAPPGTTACAFDIESFHCTCPVHPDHKPWLVVCVDDGFWIDHNTPFGTRSASSNSGQIGNAIVDIWDAEDTDTTFKYEDDMSQFQIPIRTGPFMDGLYKYRHSVSSTLSLIAPLNVPGIRLKQAPNFCVFSFLLGSFVT